MFLFILKLLLLFTANATLLWAMDTYLFYESFQITGTLHSYFYVGTLLSLLNIIVKPLLHIITLPLRFLTLGLSSLLVNALILFLVQNLFLYFPETQTVILIDGLFYYIVIGALVAFANAFFHAIGLD